MQIKTVPPHIIIILSSNGTFNRCRNRRKDCCGALGCRAYCLVSMARHSEPEPRLGTIMRCEARRIAAKIAKLLELLHAMSALCQKPTSADENSLS